MSVAILIVLSGCAALPQFGKAASPDALSPKVSDITDKFQCELIGALHSAKYDLDTTLRPLALYDHVVSVTLSLEVTNTSSVNPSLSYLNPLSAASSSFASTIGGQWADAQDRVYNQAFTLVFGLGDENSDKFEKCNQAAKSGLRGDLGIKEIIASGLRYEAADSDAYKLRVLGLSSGKLADPLASGPALAPSFGSTIEFSITYSVNGGPNWTLTHFSGPGTNILGYSKLKKDTLQLSFSRVPPSPGGPSEAANAEGQAGKAARDNLTNQVLQRLFIRP